MQKSFFSILVALILIGLGCQNNLTEDEKFDRFTQKYHKVAIKYFPETTANAAIDSLISNDLSEQEILMGVNFCREQLEQLAAFDLENLSPANRKQFIEVFAEVKAHLQKMEAAANDFIPEEQ